ncbi:hypothetical protein L4O78_005942 [Pseudomonas aeruginosa]|uniref:Uncharacterized protein n=1 Tax=Pseudomonas aeruginosa TaxID=287 RepID=A0A6M3UW16_PSEAI|nr:hypothetical protein [Pseudomonas aeruginosa]EQL43010.1 hypothetical protein M770_33390 [Pseudomonas aeruginosa VRFPA03]ESR70942.1 hypothetical protein T266_12170 [Pseudomonas aeruginosa VRFPA05]EVT82754.1 hypothetical protein Z046_31910 [Pseudomonas aeruginosa VRFPA09]AWF62397.1 hypothetical protein CSC30_3549 [Pseudomonas aeruginosa]AZP57318.1 Uncharacterized protein PA1840_0123 [Pseudomonas aeruginosa]
MLLLGAEALGMTHNQCLDLLESAEDTLDFLKSSLTYLGSPQKTENKAR